jgi:hypothetical protein
MVALTSRPGTPVLQNLTSTTGTIAPIFAADVFSYNVSTATNTFDLELQYDPTMSCVVDNDGQETPCQASQTIALGKLISKVVVAMYFAGDSPAVFTNYTLTVYQPICTVTTFSVEESYSFPIVCTSKAPPDEYSVASGCITNSSLSMVMLNFTSQNACDDPTMAYFDKDWVNCSMSACPLAPNRNRFRVSFSNALVPSELNITNGMIIIVLSLFFFDVPCSH